jgi:excisionase family DNA binding protein
MVFRGYAEHSADLHGGAAMRGCDSLPLLLTPWEAGELLRTSRKAIYSMVERGQLPGVTRVGRRLLIRSADLVDFLDHNSTPSLQEAKR